MKSRLRLDIKEYKRHRYTLTLLSRALFPCSSPPAAISARAAPVTHPTTPGSRPTALSPAIRSAWLRVKRIRSAKSPARCALNGAYLPFDPPGTFWTRYEAVNEAVVKLLLVPVSASTFFFFRETGLIGCCGFCELYNALERTEMNMYSRFKVKANYYRA